MKYHSILYIILFVIIGVICAFITMCIVEADIPLWLKIFLLK